MACNVSGEQLRAIESIQYKGSTVLQCTALYCTDSCCTELHCLVLYCAAALWVLQVSFALPLRERFLHLKGSSSGANPGHRPSKELTPVSVLSRSGGLEIDVSALRDRLGAPCGWTLRSGVPAHPLCTGVGLKGAAYFSQRSSCHVL